MILDPHMKAFAEENNIMTSPRRSLISSFKGKKQTFATPLLKWYLKHGLVITKVYEFISYEPQKCFESFGEFVCDARRAGDNDPTQAIIADCAKLIGNSGNVLLQVKSYICSIFSVYSQTNK
ncbi:uncharacterized protein LOC113475350 [Ciona intestinalis]